MMLVSFGSNTMDATCGIRAAYPFGAPGYISGFSWIHVARSLFYKVMFCKSLFVILSFFLWSVCCLYFFDLHLLITPSISSDFSCTCTLTCYKYRGLLENYYDIYQCPHCSMLGL